MKLPDLRPLSLNLILPSRRSFRGPFLLGLTVGVGLTAGAIVVAALTQKKSPDPRLLGADRHDHPEDSGHAQTVAPQAQT